MLRRIGATLILAGFAVGVLLGIVALVYISLSVPWPIAGLVWMCLLVVLGVFIYAAGEVYDDD